jgi:NAD(P)-dependent dehydrogenase (short-subunit alcohol dehydrogenase family)
VKPGTAALPGTIGETAEQVAKLGGHGIAVRVDHADDAQIKALFERVADEQGGRLDILVNNVFKVPDTPVWGGSFWEHPIAIWDDMVGVGLRAHYVASVYGAPLMVRAKRGLIANISSRGAAQYAMSTAYGVGKCGLDRLAKDMAHELKPHGVAAVALWPSAVRTEFVMDQASKRDIPIDLTNSESPRFSGAAVVALASDPLVMEKSGRTWRVKELAELYGFSDPDPAR